MIRPRTTLRDAAMTAGLSGADENGEAMMTCQYPAPPARTANARPRARPTREMLRPTGARRDGSIGAFGEPFIGSAGARSGGVGPAVVPAAPRRDPTAPAGARRRWRSRAA